MKCWYVAYCHSGAEQSAKTNLNRQNYETWLPLYRKVRRHARKTETVLKPLFPRYIFIEIDLNTQPWRPIVSTFGIQSIISTADGPSPIENNIVYALMEKAEQDGIFEIKQDKFKSGDQIRIQNGPMADVEGIFETELDSERILILLKLMGREVRVSVDEDNIRRV